MWVGVYIRASVLGLICGILWSLLLGDFLRDQVSSLSLSVNWEWDIGKENKVNYWLECGLESASELQFWGWYAWFCEAYYWGAFFRYPGVLPSFIGQLRIRYMHFWLHQNNCPFAPCATQNIAHEKGLMCCIWFALNLCVGHVTMHTGDRSSQSEEILSNLEVGVSMLHFLARKILCNVEATGWNLIWCWSIQVQHPRVRFMESRKTTAFLLCSKTVTFVCISDVNL